MSKKQGMKNHRGHTSEERYCEKCCARDEEGRPVIQGKEAVEKRVDRGHARVCSKCKEYVRVYYVLSWRDKQPQRDSYLARNETNNETIQRLAREGSLKGYKVC